MSKRASITTTDWQACVERSRSAAVQRKTQFYLLAGGLSAGRAACAEHVEAFGVLVFQFFWQQQVQKPQVLTAAVFANQDVHMGTALIPVVVLVRVVDMDGLPNIVINCKNDYNCNVHEPSSVDVKQLLNKPFR